MLTSRMRVFSDFVIVNMYFSTCILRHKMNIHVFCWRARPRYMFALLYRKTQVKCFKTESGYACFRTCFSCTDVHLDLCFAIQNACPLLHSKSVCFSAFAHLDLKTLFKIACITIGCTCFSHLLYYKNICFGLRFT